MALALLDRVQQTGTANTTVSFTVTGSVAGYQSWSAVGNGNTTYYGASDASGNWEVGLATYSTTGPTVTRTAIFASSNAGAQCLKTAKRQRCWLPQDGVALSAAA